MIRLALFGAASLMAIARSLDHTSAAASGDSDVSRAIPPPEDVTHPDKDGRNSRPAVFHPPGQEPAGTLVSSVAPPLGRNHLEVIASQDGSGLDPLLLRGAGDDLDRVNRDRASTDPADRVRRAADPSMLKQVDEINGLAIQEPKSDAELAAERGDGAAGADASSAGNQSELAPAGQSGSNTGPIDDGTGGKPSALEEGARRQNADPPAPTGEPSGADFLNEPAGKKANGKK